MIVEGLLTSSPKNGPPHVAPLGPVVSEDQQVWLLRPYETSATFALLRENPNCIFHVMDDVLPFAQAVVGLPCEVEFSPHPKEGFVIASACRWFRLEIIRWDVSNIRSEASARIVDCGSLREFWGWNRAKHAVLEAAILASRIGMLEWSDVEAQLKYLAIAVDKTAGARERQAWELLMDYFSKHQA